MARRHTPEQVIAKVRQGQKMRNDGWPMIEVIKELQITEATWYRWLQQYGSEKNADQTKCHFPKPSAQMSKDVLTGGFRQQWCARNFKRRQYDSSLTDEKTLIFRGCREDRWTWLGT